MEEVNDILSRIKAIRKSKGLTQLDVSEKIGLSKNNYGKLEIGLVELSVKRLFEVSSALDVSVETLLGIDNVNESRVEALEAENKALKASLKEKEQFVNTITGMMQMFGAGLKNNPDLIKDGKMDLQQIENNVNDANLSEDASMEETLKAAFKLKK